MPDNGPDNASEARQRHYPRPYIINRAGRTSVNGTTERVRRLSNSHPLTTLVPCRTKSWQNQDSVVCIVRRLPVSHSQTSTVLVPIRNNNNHDNPQSSIVNRRALERGESMPSACNCESETNPSTWCAAAYTRCCSMHVWQCSAS